MPRAVTSTITTEAAAESFAAELRELLLATVRAGGVIDLVGPEEASARYGTPPTPHRMATVFVACYTPVDDRAT